MDLETALTMRGRVALDGRADLDWLRRFPRRLQRDPAARLYLFGLPGAGVSTELGALSATLEAAGYTCAHLKLGPRADLSLGELHLALAEAACAAGEDEPFGALLEFCPPPEGDTISLYPLQRISEWRREMSRRASARRRFAAQVEAMEDSFFERARAALLEVNERLKAEGGGLVLFLDGLARLQDAERRLFEHPQRWALPLPMIFAPPLALFTEAPPRARALLGAAPPVARAHLFKILSARLPLSEIFQGEAQAEAARVIGTPGDLFNLLRLALELDDPPFTAETIREAARIEALALRDRFNDEDHLDVEGARLTPATLSRLTRGVWQLYTDKDTRVFTPHPLLDQGR